MTHEPMTQPSRPVRMAEISVLTASAPPMIPPIAPTIDATTTTIAAELVAL